MAGTAKPNRASPLTAAAERARPPTSRIAATTSGARMATWSKYGFRSVMIEILEEPGCNQRQKERANEKPVNVMMEISRETGLCPHPEKRGKPGRSPHQHPGNQDLV